MATIHASVGNFFSITDLASRGIGSGKTISHPTVPTFLSDSVKSTGVNYATLFSQSMIGSKSLGSMVSDYDSAKTSFQSEFKQAMGVAKKTGEALKNMDYRGSSADGMSSGNGLGNSLRKKDTAVNSTGTRDGNGLALYRKGDEEDKPAASSLAGKKEAASEANDGSAPQKDDALANESRRTPPFQAAESTARELTNIIEQYNDTVGYLQSKVGMSSQFDFFAASFNDTKGLARGMDDIGVNVEPTGMLSVDQDTLAKALQEKPESVEQTLGQEGLGGQLEQRTATTDFQAGRMFPSIEETLGQPDDAAKGMYAPNMQISATMRGNSGKLMDMYY